MRRELLSDVRYLVDLDLTTSSGARSRTEIRFGCAEPGAPAWAALDVDAVRSMSLNGRALPASSWRDARLALPSLESENLLVVEADVSFAAKGERGLVSFTDGGDRFVYSYGKPYAPARWLCSFLGVPGTIELRVEVPEGWSVVSQVPASGRWRFVLDDIPRHAEGIVVAAGPWATVDDGRVPLHARPSVADVLAASPVAALVDEVIDFHEQLLGVPYPYAQRDGVFVPGYGSQAGSSGGIVVFHERVLHASVSDEWRRYVLWVVAHELAHAWFGNLVVGDSGANRWLGEGTATYLCHRAMEALAPEMDPWARFHVLEIAEAHDNDVPGADHPSLVYGKPAAVMRALESVIGRAAVDAGLGAFVRGHARRSAVGDDLVRAWSTAAGFDLTPWADAWLRAPGVNTLTLDTDTWVIHQSGTPLRTHHLRVRAFDEGLVERDPVGVVVGGARTAVPSLLGRPDPALVVLDASAGYARVRLDDRSRATLAESLGALDPSVRAVCWVAAWEMAKDGLVPFEELRALIDAFAADEPDPQVRDLLSSISPPAPS